MKNIFITAAFLLINVLTAQQISSTFGTSSEDWLVVGDATSANPTFIAESGNPGGYVSADDTATGGVWNWLAPAKFLGNQNESYGKTLSFDLKQSSIFSQFDDADIVITGPEIALAFDLTSNPGLDWTHYAVTLNDTNPWRINNLTGALATAEQIMLVLSNITSLKIRGEYVSGSDTGGIDNVILETTRLSAASFSASKGLFYPNPVTHTIYFADSVSEISIYNLNGAKKNISILNHTADISELSNGIYILKLVSDDNNIIQKIIKN